MERKKYHFIGIGGIGMSALANILLKKGERVSGSDLSSNYVTKGLIEAGAHIQSGHSGENIDPDMIVIYSTAVSKENEELQKALQIGIPLLHRSELLAQLMSEYAPLLVAGSHGKTTTSSLLAHVLADVHLDPSYAIGGVVRSLKANGGYGQGPYFVAEADESDGSFLTYPALGAIITNIDNDHLDYWMTTEALIAGFKRFADQIGSRDHLFWCADDSHLRSLCLPGTSYGFSQEAGLRITHFNQRGWTTLFTISFQGQEYKDIEIPLIGKHNVLNTAAVFGFGLRLNISEPLLRRALGSFQGVGRRVEKKGEAKAIEVYDDYAHHPTEILTTLKAIKSASEGKRLVVAFQPHRYTRTRDCMDQFPDAFVDADVLILADIYSAGEKSIDGITTERLLENIRNKIKDRVRYVPRQDLVRYLAGFLEPNDVLITMGAGDVTKVGPDLLMQL